MNAVSKTLSPPMAACLQPFRIMAVSLPRLSTDRIRRERLGRSWRSDARREEAAGAERLPAARSAAGRPAHAAASSPALGLAAAAPLVLYESVANANRLVALCEAASGLGLRAGMGLSEARARFPDLDVLEADPGADAALLEAIADWCDRYTPLVALDPPHGLVLDISGCAHLFGGEKALMDDLLARLFHQGFAAHAAIASHAGTALAMVAGRQVPTLAAEGKEAAAIEALSVAALRLGAEPTAMLERLGLKTIGTLLALPRQSLSRRFGAGLMARLDEAAGRASRPISPRLQVPLIIAERRFAQSISLVEDVERILLHLADRVGADLERRCEGARRLRLSLFRVDGKVDHVEVAASRPIRRPERVHALFRERLKGLGNELDSGFGYDCIKLSVLEAEAMTERQEDLAGDRDDDEDLRSLLDRIAARLGERSVLGLTACESHLPERAAGLEPAARLADRPDEGGTGLPPERPPRPLRLLDNPEAVEAVAEVPEGPPMRFRWRRALHTVRRCEGPERIASEWWRNDSGETRDYYRIEDEEGRRYWLFREGFYGAGTPSWYLHGLFA